MSIVNSHNSGVPWIGAIPETWDVVPFRYLFRESSEVNGSSPVGQMLSVSGYRGVEPKVYSDESQQRTDDELEKYRVVRPGQLAVNTMWLNYSGLGVAEHFGHVSPAYRAYDIHPRLDRRYVHHLLRSSVYVDAYTGSLTGVRPNSLQMPRQVLQSWPVLVPPIEEQRRIAEFLDRETTQIDELIAKQEQLISTLAERRQAQLLAMLRGPVGMDCVSHSALNWLGPVSRTWPVGRVKHLGTAVLGKMIESEASPKTSVLAPYLRAANVQPNGVLALDDAKEMWFSPAELSRLTLRKGDVVVVEGGMGGYGRAAFVGEDLKGWGFQNSIIRVRPVGADGRYLSYFLVAARSAGEISLACEAVSMPHFTVDRLTNFPIPIPELSEQRRIADALEKQMTAVNLLLKKTEAVIEALRERRQALISAAVTGQIDVGGAS